jgi:anaerobic ribonucleoside-triphosphate reductase
MMNQLKRLLRLRPDHCRDCGEEVAGFTDICANCGAANPVHVPRWIGYIIVGFTIQNFLLMFS